MKTILDEIAEKTRRRIEEKKKEVPLEALKEKIASQTYKKQPYLFEKRLAARGLSFICEVKKASPSKGVIAEKFLYKETAAAYEKAGAAAISCLTEPYYFMGSDKYLEEIAQLVSIPVLRKDFTIDSYMIYEAKAMKADGVLLICALLDDETLRNYLALTKKLGMSALVEAHSGTEVSRALKAGASVIGVNNRDLKTFHVDLNTSLRLRTMVPRNKIFVAESGIKTPEDIAALSRAGADAVLIGETLMRMGDIGKGIQALKGAADENSN